MGAISEYQYFEFVAVDRPLVVDEMAALRELSTRAQISPTSFVNTYHWGNFRGDPQVMVERYFDAYLHETNWGTRQVMFRLPTRLLDAGTAEQYCYPDSAEARQHGPHIILDFVLGEGEGWTGRRTPSTGCPRSFPARADLLRELHARKPSLIDRLDRAGLGGREPAERGRA